MQRYTRTAMGLHWLMAILILVAISLGLFVASMPGLSPAKLRYVALHKWIGLTLLLLAVCRLSWRCIHAPPPLPDGVPGWERQAARALHLVFYVQFFLVPISGYLYSLAAGVPVIWFGLIPLPVLIEPNAALKPLLRSVHFWLNLSLIANITMHIVAALKHRFFDRDEVLQRMLPPWHLTGR